MKTSLIAYSVNGAPYEGVLVYDGSVTALRPALLLAPDWMGVSDLSVSHALHLAATGYVVFVADMYGTGRRPKNPDKAAALAGPLKDDIAEARRRARGALEALRSASRHLIAAAPPAAIGFCFGGANVLELCRAGTDLSAAISIHGDLGAREPAAPGAIRSPVLVIHGAADQLYRTRNVMRSKPKWMRPARAGR
jgi:dienelactone hydrolase